MIRSMNFSITILFFLLIASLPNNYFSTLISIMLFIYKVINCKKIRIPARMKKNSKNVMLLFIIGILSFIMNYSHIQNLFWGVFTLSTFFIYIYLIDYRVGNTQFNNTIKIYISIEICILIIQFINQVIKNKTMNLFSISIAAGDNFSGTFGNSHILTVVFGYLSIYYLSYYLKYRKELNMFIITSVAMLFPSYLSGILVFFVSLIISFLFIAICGLLKLKLNKKIFIVLVMIMLSVSVLYITQSENIRYGKKIIQSVMTEKPPRKILGVKNTIQNFSKDNLIKIIGGVGFGNYSSRAAFIVSGQYLRTQPSWIPPSPSEYTVRYVLPLWNKSILRIPFSDGVANQPFIQFQSIYGEMGIIGLFIFIYILIKSNMTKKNMINKYYLPLFNMIFILLQCLFENIFEYPIFCILYWIIVSRSLYINTEISNDFVLKNKNIAEYPG